MRVTLFWTVFTACAIWAQSFFPPLDFMAAGLVVSIQEESPARTLWLALIWTVLQEGMGSLAFGTVILIYAAFAVLYYFGRWLFEARNFLFVCLLGLGYTLLRLALTSVMIRLQGVAVPQESPWSLAVAQALLLPVEWMIVSGLYVKLVKAKHNVVRI